MMAAGSLSDAEIAAYINDPATIATHEVAIEIIGILDAEIASIQTQLDAAALAAAVQPLSPDRLNWANRAAYAAAIRRQERHRVWQRDRELRGTKGSAATPPKHTPEEKRLREERLLAEARDRRAKRDLELTGLRVQQEDIAQRRRELRAADSYERKFVAAARAMLTEAAFADLDAAARRSQQ